MNDRFKVWYEKMVEQRNRLEKIDWRQVRITNAERQLIAPSIRTFQLGETGQGRHLFKCAENWVKKTGHHPYLEALRILFEDEGRHSGELGHFMDEVGIPRQNKSKLNGTFRFIRRLAGIEIIATTLAIAETVALIYYRALYRATNSKALRVLCRNMLVDEGLHLGFQSSFVHEIDSKRNFFILKIVGISRWILFMGSSVAVWIRYRDFFIRTGFHFKKFIVLSNRNFAIVFCPNRRDHFNCI